MAIWHERAYFAPKLSIAAKNYSQFKIWHLFLWHLFLDTFSWPAPFLQRVKGEKESRADLTPFWFMVSGSPVLVCFEDILYLTTSFVVSPIRRWRRVGANVTITRQVIIVCVRPRLASINHGIFHTRIKTFSTSNFPGSLHIKSIHPRKDPESQPKSKSRS